MSITIRNLGGDDPDPEGEREYEVRVNWDRIVTFRHRRGDGLVVCLERAARAVEQAWGRRTAKDKEAMNGS